MENQTCQTCKYYHQHYVKYGKNHYLPVDEGHCAHPRLKFRKPETPACQKFSAQRSDT